MENKIELRKIPCGETFIVFGEEFVVLDYIDDGALSIRKEIWRDAPFDTDANNDLREASILKVLGEYMTLLKKNGAIEEAFIPMHIDLKAVDGTRAYDYYNGDIGLLSLEQYGKYKDIIPFADDRWWLASPRATRWLHSPTPFGPARLWYVDSDGSYGNGHASSSYGVRPVLNFVPCLLVSLHEKESESGKEDEVTRKKKEWGAYLDYLSQWIEDNETPENHGMTPVTFDQWLEKGGASK